VGKRNAMSGWQLASQRLNLNDQFWGEKPGNVYFAARRCSSRSSCADNLMEYGLRRGIAADPCPKMPYVSEVFK
jgi:hypothetical protein